MTSRSPRKKIESSRYLNFKEVAGNFYEGAKIASEYSYYKDIDALLKHFERYKAWIDELLK